MGNASFWAVEGLLCLPLAALVWASQHALNRLHPSRRPLGLGPVLPRAIVLLVLLVATCLLATGLFLAAAMAAPNWQARWSEVTLWQAFAEGCGLALTVVVICANLARRVQARRAPGAQGAGSSRDQEEPS